MGSWVRGFVCSYVRVCACTYEARLVVGMKGSSRAHVTQVHRGAVENSSTSHRPPIAHDPHCLHRSGPRGIAMGDAVVVIVAVVVVMVVALGPRVCCAPLHPSLQCTIRSERKIFANVSRHWSATDV